MPDTYVPKPPEGGRVRSFLINFFWGGLSLCLINYGANDPVTVALGTLLFFALLLFTLLSLGMAKSTQVAFNACVLLMFSTLLWVAFQNTPLPGDWLADPAWKEVLWVSPVARTVISVSPGDDLASSLKLACPLSVFLNSLLLFRDDKGAERALRVYSFAGAVVAFMSILQFTFFPRWLLFTNKPGYMDSLTAFFVNRNTAATFLGLICILNFTFLWHATRQVDLGRIMLAFDYRQPLSKTQRHSLRQLIGYLVGFLLTVLALVLTKSRAGITASIVSLVILIIFLTFAGGTSIVHHGHVRRKHIILRVLIAVGLTSGLALLFASVSGRVMLRAAARGLDDTRYCILPGLLAEARDHVITGSGLASFQETFSAYRDPACGIQSVIDKAHNFYLEGLITLGLMFPVLLAASTAYLVAVFAGCVRRRRSYQFVGGVGISVLTLVLLHSAVDFSLQIPGFSISLAAVLAPLVTLASGRAKSSDVGFLNPPLCGQRRVR